MIKNKKVLITGFAGSIGSELARQLCTKNKVYGIDMNETEMFDLIEEYQSTHTTLDGFVTYTENKIEGEYCDIRNINDVQEIFEKFKPDIVFHCAALKHVTPNEFKPIEAIRTNVLGTYNIAYNCQKYGAKLINISTDKVVNADSIMGITKKLAEKICKNMHFNSVRFGNVMGSRGSVIPIWQRQIDQNKALTITDKKMTRYMMTIPDAVELVIKASEMPQDGRIVILDMGTPVSILELAMAIIKSSGKNVGIKEIGIRPGETLTETLMTPEEERQATKQGKFFII